MSDATERTLAVYTLRSAESAWGLINTVCEMCGAPTTPHVAHTHWPDGRPAIVYYGPPPRCADCGARMRAEDEARQAASRRAWAEEVYARHFAAVGGDRAAALAALERVYEEWEE